MKQFSILFLAIYTLLFSIGCVPELSDQETISSPQTTNTQKDTPPTIQEEKIPINQEATSNINKDETLLDETKEATLSIDEGSSKIVFSASPIDVENIASITPLGTLNPPGHTFPTGHIGFYIIKQEGLNVAQEVTLYSPGTYIVTRVNAIEHLNKGITDYAIAFQEPDSFYIRLGHISSLAEDVFGNTTDFQTWELTDEYSTWNETYRWWTKEYDLKIEAGQVIGTVGGIPGINALDFLVRDFGQIQLDVANPERWADNGYLHAVDPLNYYEDNLVFKQLIKLVDREMSEGEKPPYGLVLQDIPGTAQGCWFLSGVKETNPETPHLALVHQNRRPRFRVLSVGSSIENLPPVVYEFLPKETGVVNREFSDITADHIIYGYDIERFDGIVLVHMPDSETLWIEALEYANTNPTSWIFTENKTIFKR
ncbi:hypothetical protein ACFLW1_01270 [Chloroflexota bacterium]